MTGIKDMGMKDDETVLLFLKFAIQCSGSPLNRTLIPPEDEAKARELVSKGKLPDRGFERRYRAAYGGCSILALEREKKEIDKEVVEEYFLYRHNSNLDTDLAMGRTYRDDIDCKTYPGAIEKIEDKEFATVKTPAGEMRCSRVFVGELGVGSLVAVHRNVIAIQISDDMATKMERLLNSNHNSKRLRSVG